MTPGARELKRLAYLQAIGIDSYISRRQLPGAAPSSRLAVVPRGTPGTTPGGPQGKAAEAITVSAPAGNDRPARLPAGVLPVIEAAEGRAERGPTERGPTERGSADPVPAFTVSAILCGGLLWVEELNYPVLAREQVQLVQSMARALGRPGGAVDVEQFNWPIHRNSQFDLGEDAARAGLAGYVCRRLEEHGCSVLVLLGQGSERWLGDLTMPGIKRLATVSTAAMLSEPELKRRAWQDLLPLVKGA